MKLIGNRGQINMIRLDAYWTPHPLDRTRSSHLTRFDITLTA
ncbi:MAG: hypothetical protein ACRDQ5_00930 [Sciscionella sp.]